MRKSDPEMGIRIGIITVRDSAYHPNRRLLEAAREAGCQGVLIHPYRIWPTTMDGRLGLIGEPADRLPQVVLPRQGAEIGDTCLALIHHFQRMGIPLVNDLAAVTTTRNKFLTQQVLTAAGLPCPATVFVNEAPGFAPAVARLGGYPVVAKPVNARQGEGVLLVKDAEDACLRVLTGLDRRRGVMVQRFIAPVRRRDIRALVIGGEAVCAASLTPRQGEFRANFHLGSDIRGIDLPDELAKLAVAAAKAVGCDVAGVDLMVAGDGRPLIVEVNYSPGFRGMEGVSGLDVAGHIIHLAVDRYMEKLK
jgi:ribosomal protein S6--L-glutamate ligase